MAAACEAAGGALEDDEVGAPGAVELAHPSASWDADCSEVLAAYIATSHDATRRDALPRVGAAFFRHAMSASTSQPKPHTLPEVLVEQHRSEIEAQLIEHDAGSGGAAVAPENRAVLPIAAMAAHTVVPWNVHCSESLAALIATPRNATHGTWSAAQHTGVKRAIFLRSFRFAQRHVGVAGTSPHLQALSEVANSGNVMRIVLRFAMAQYCTPTRAERQAICTMCHTSNQGEVDIVRFWLRCGVDPNTIVWSRILAAWRAHKEE